MRRLALTAGILAVAALGLALRAGSQAQGSSNARFDVIFDDARGLIGGQLVKVAGAQAGTIQNVVVTSNVKARVEATVDSRFMPFHEDATCEIRPEGLIAENYVDCDPGSVNSPMLKGKGGKPPTVPVTNTSEPVSLLDLFNMFNLPTTQRLQVLINELGIGTSGTGENFNDILRRANPALALAHQAIGILQQQRSQLASIVDATNTIAQQGATHTANLQRFLDKSAALTSLTAQHRDGLSQSVARLPGLLAATQPALQQLDTVAVDGTPLLQQLHASVPSLNRAVNDLGPFVTAAKPALQKMGVALKQAIPALRATSPVLTTIRSYTSRSLPGTKLFARLAENLQQHGFVENFLSVAYSIATSLSRFDSTSHMLSILLVGPDNGVCGNYSTKPVPACSAHYGQHASYKPSSAARPSRPHAHRRAARGVRAKSPAPRTGAGVHHGAGPRKAHQQQSSTTTTATTTTTPSVPVPSAPVHQTAQSLQGLINYLLK